MEGGQIVGLDGVGGPEPLGHLQLLVHQVDGHDDRRPRHLGALDHRDANAAAPEHDDLGTGLDLGGVDGRTHTGAHPASDERGDVEGHVIVDLDGCLLGQRDVFGERAGTGHAEQLAVALGEAGQTGDGELVTREQRRG